MSELLRNTPCDWENPKWNKLSKCYEWKRYIAAEVQGIWDTFTNEQKQALARMADARADREEWD